MRAGWWTAGTVTPHGRARRSTLINSPADLTAITIITSDGELQSPSISNVETSLDYSLLPGSLFSLQNAMTTVPRLQNSSYRHQPEGKNVKNIQRSLQVSKLRQCRIVLLLHKPWKSTLFKRVLKADNDEEWCGSAGKLFHGSTTLLLKKRQLPKQPCSIDVRNFLLQ